MAFCINCGGLIGEGAKYCSECGYPVANKKDNNTARETVYEGKLHKCPNCGELLESFIANCPTCGYEVRNAKISDSVKDFFTKIGQVVSNEEKVTLIRNFPISNSKEDVFEFIVFASTNAKGEINKEVFYAWLAKLEQCYQKAELLFGNDSDFDTIKKIYEQTQKTTSKEKKLREVKSAGSTIIQFYKNMKNPIWGIVCTIVIIANLVAMITGSFESDGTSILFSMIILFITYVITNKK